jgi:Excalibur calcium-binding domain
MFRALLVAAAIAVTPINVAPAASADPLDANCIAGKMNEDGSCYYANCSEAKAAGECDILEGDAHYCPKQDRDSDGIACEC